jgi:hypothetical protein
VWNKAGVEEAKKDFFSHIKCDDTGTIKEYIGNKIDRKDEEIKMTQPVLLQSFTDEFDLVRDHKITVPAAQECFGEQVVCRGSFQVLFWNWQTPSSNEVESSRNW